MMILEATTQKLAQPKNIYSWDEIRYKKILKAIYEKQFQCSIIKRQEIII